MQSTKSHTQPQFVICLDNTGYAASLGKGKVYQLIPDADAASFGEVRIVDESGEDYLFPARRFVIVTCRRKSETCCWPRNTGSN